MSSIVDLSRSVVRSRQGRRQSWSEEADELDPQIKTYNPKTGMDVLTVTPCSVASANQRSGRAGRTQPGKSYRLYPRSAITLGIMPPTTPPELIRSDISLFILQLKALGIDNVLRFDWMDSPPSEMMIRAMEFLFSLKAIDESGRLTRPLGVCMAEVPVDPMMAAIVSPIGRACSIHIATSWLITFDLATQFAHLSMWGRDLDDRSDDFGTERVRLWRRSGGCVGRGGEEEVYSRGRRELGGGEI